MHSALIVYNASSPGKEVPVMRVRSLLRTIAVSPLVSVTGLAQSNTLRGKVRSTGGLTIKKRYRRTKAAGGGMLGQTVTRNDGDFAFSNLPSASTSRSNGCRLRADGQMARFNTPHRMNFAEVVNIEVIIRPRVAAILAAPGTNFTQDVPKPARALYEKGIGRLREGKSDEGIAILREAISAFNDYFIAHFELGLELFRQGKNNEALEEFERARQINQREDAVYFMFGMVMLKEQKFTIAQRAFREASSLNPNRPRRVSIGPGTDRARLEIEDPAQRNADLSDAEKELNRAWSLSNGRLSSVSAARAHLRRSGDREAAARELKTT